MDWTPFDQPRTPQFIAGLALAALAAILMMTADVTISAPITVLVVGIILIATSRREDPGT